MKYVEKIKSHFFILYKVIKRANDVKYGLASCVYSKDIDVINKVSRGIKAGFNLSLSYVVNLRHCSRYCLGELLSSQ